MNCTQAQVLLAAHRELKKSEVDTTELDVHLEQCSSCRQVLAGYSFIGEQVRSLPLLEPSPAQYSKLMSALAAEHTRFIQKSAAATPPPEFLKPYLSDAGWRRHSSHKTDSLTTFSTADTGPLPIIYPARKKRQRSHVGQFAALGLVAVFFIALMMGGLTSLLFLAHDNLPGRSGVTSIERPIDVTSATYTTATQYQHVVSAVADRTSIYYSAYADGTNSGWMLEQMNRVTKISTPLLTTPGTSPLIVLGSDNGWLVWLQLDTSKNTTRTSPHHELLSPLQSWSLHALSLATQLQDGITVPNKPMTITSGTFNQETAPSWVHSPIQGIWFVQNTLLVAGIDNNGISRLLSYPLDPKSIFRTTQIAKAAPGHILTSPTANSDGTKIYWADEWRSEDDSLHSNIWTQQVFDTPDPTPGHLAQQTMTEKQLFLQDGMSFRPLVADSTLFFLSTANATDVTQGTPATTPAATPTTAATPNISTPVVSWADTSVYTPPLDNDVHGNLLMFPLGNSPAEPTTIVNTTGSASMLQAGSNFVLWQNDDGSYGMFDATAKTDVTVGDMNGAQFLAVNGDTAVWTLGNTGNAANATPNGTVPSTTLIAFNWPRK